MKILHTADWHLGLELKGYSRLEEQKLFLQWMLEQCKVHSPQALIIAGDLFDTFNPSIDAQKSFHEFVVQLRFQNPHIELISIAGNHDSSSRLELPEAYAMALGKIHFIGQLEESNPTTDAKGIIPLRNTQGEVQACVIALPFLKPVDIRTEILEGEFSSQSFNRALIQFVQALRTKAEAQYPHVPLILVGHLFLENSLRGGSERALVGGLEGVVWQGLCDGFAYVALGHIHRAQNMDQGRIRYSGSPLSIDIEERSYDHSISLVDFDSSIQVQTIPVPEFVPMLRIPAKAGDWSDVHHELSKMQLSAEISWDLQPLVQPHLRQENSLEERQWQIQKILNDFPIRVLTPKVTSLVDNSTDDSSIAVTPSLQLHDPQMPLFLLEKEWKRTRGDVELPADLRAAFEEIVNQVILEGK